MAEEKKEFKRADTKSLFVNNHPTASVSISVAGVNISFNPGEQKVLPDHYDGKNPYIARLASAGDVVKKEETKPSSDELKAQEAAKAKAEAEAQAAKEAEEKAKAEAEEAKLKAEQEAKEKEEAEKKAAEEAAAKEAEEKAKLEAEKEAEKDADAAKNKTKPKFK